MSTSALPCPTNFHVYAPGFAAALASMSDMPDAGHAACPQEWRDLTALLHILIEDEGMTTTMTARETALPEITVARYRRLVGI